MCGVNSEKCKVQVADCFLRDVGAVPWQMSKIRTVKYIKM
jgi:hypothetical protein